MREIALAEEARKVMHFSVAESYPLEVAGILIGHDGPGYVTKTSWVIAAIPFTRYEKRGMWSLTIEDARHLEDVVHMIYPDMDIVGGFHSHTRGVTTASQEDKEGIEEDDFELVVSVWPGKRKPFRFVEKAYYKNLEGKIQRVHLVKLFSHI